MINRKIIDDYNDVGVLILPHGSPILPISPCKPIVRLRIRSRWSSNNYNNTGTAGPRHHDTTNDMPKSLIVAVAIVSQRWRALALFRGALTNFQSPPMGRTSEERTICPGYLILPPRWYSRFLRVGSAQRGACHVPKPPLGRTSEE